MYHLTANGFNLSVTKEFILSNIKERKPRQGQIDQTKQWIFQALIQLMKVNTFSKINFSHIAEKAGISRQSVYRHFSIPKDILIWFLDQQFECFFKMAEQEPIADNKATVLRNSKLAFSFCKKHREFLDLLVYHQLEYIFLSKIEEFVHIISRDFGTAPDEITQLYREKYFAGGFYMFTIQWLKDSVKISDEEVIRMLTELVKL